MSNMIFNGMRVFISEPVKYEFTTSRSWKERLFTLPFKPLQATKTTVIWSNPIEDGKVIKHDRFLHMTEKTWIDLQAHIKDAGLFING